MFKRSIVFAFLCSISSFSLAQEIRPVEVAAGDLTAALESLARQIGVELVYQTDQLKGLTTEGVAGVLSAEEAVTKLLEGTTLTLKTDPSGAMLIAREREESDAKNVANASNFVEGRGVRLAQGEGRSAQEDEGKEEDILDPEYVSDENPRGIPEILVVGSRSLNVDIVRSRDDTQPYVVFDREAIERSGATNLEGFFKTRLTMNAAPVSQSQLGGGSSQGNTSRIDLRGLGSDETLILVDGRRIAGIGFSGDIGQPDVNGIPLTAVERIEVLPTTASGIYGGGATGGAINIVLRGDYSGLEAQLTYGNSFDTDTASRRIDLNAGWNFNEGRTNVLLAGSWSDANVLLIGDRDFVQRGRTHVLHHNPDFFYEATLPPLGATTNIRSATGIDLILKNGTPLNSPITWVPYGYPGPAADAGAGLAANAGQFNLNLPRTVQPQGERQALLNSPTVGSLIATLRHDFAPRVQGFLELNASDNHGNAQRAAFLSSLVIPATSPNNPFLQDIRVSVPWVGAEGITTLEVESRRAATGVIFKLPLDWQSTVEASWQRSRLAYKTAGYRTADLGSAVIRGEVDVLRDLNSYPVDLSPFFGAPSSQQSADTDMKNSAIRLAGPLPWELAAGRPSLSALLEHREEELGSSILYVMGEPFTAYPSQSQTVDSLYLEATLPLISNRNRKWGVESLELQVAARHDNYRINAAPAVNLANLLPVERIILRESSTDPTFGLRYQPLKDLTLRTSYGTGYLPPSVRQLVPGSSPVSNFPLGQILGLTDPLRGNELIGPVTLFFFNEGALLKAEQSESWSTGLIFSPQSIPALRVSADWVRIKKEDAISRVFDFRQATLNEESEVPGLIVRGPVIPGDPFSAGPIVGVNVGLFNIAQLETEAVDFAIDYGLDTDRIGRFDFALIATRLLHLETQLTPSTPIVESAGAATAVFSGDGGGGLKWKANASLTWNFRNWMLGWTTNYFDGYFLNPDHAIVPNQGAATVPSQTYHNVFGRYQFTDNRQMLSWLSGMEIRFGVNNLFNREPPIDVSSGLDPFYYSMWGDPRLANYYVTILKHLGGS